MSPLFPLFTGSIASYRGDAKHRTRNLEIPRCAIAHLWSGPSDHPGMTALNNKAAAASSSNRGHRWFPYLFAVADAIDRTGPVVGDQDRAVLGEHDIGGAAEIAGRT